LTTTILILLAQLQGLGDQSKNEQCRFSPGSFDSLYPSHGGVK